MWQHYKMIKMAKEKKVAQKRKYTTITIPAPLFEKIQEKIATTGFSSVSDYVTFVLRETVVQLNTTKPNKKENNDVIDKLRALGYVE